MKKGKDASYDSYSGFQDDGGQKTEMDQILKRNAIQKLVVYGIATDYCVKATAIDAADAGYKVIVIEGLCKGGGTGGHGKGIERDEGQRDNDPKGTRPSKDKEFLKVK